MQEIMTDYQFKALLRLVIDILNGSTDKADAIEKLEKLLDKDD